MKVGLGTCVTSLSSVGRSVCHNFLKGCEVTFSCFLSEHLLYCIIAGFDCRVGKQFLAALESLPANRTRPRMNDPLKCKTFVRSVVHENYLVIRQCRGSTDFLSLIKSAVKLLVYVICMSFHMRPRYFFCFIFD